MRQLLGVRRPVAALVFRLIRNFSDEIARLPRWVPLRFESINSLECGDLSPLLALLSLKIAFIFP